MFVFLLCASSEGLSVAKQRDLDLEGIRCKEICLIFHIAPFHLGCFDFGLNLEPTCHNITWLPSHHNLFLYYTEISAVQYLTISGKYPTVFCIFFYILPCGHFKVPWVVRRNPVLTLKILRQKTLWFVA